MTILVVLDAIPRPPDFEFEFRLTGGSSDIPPFRLGGDIASKKFIGLAPGSYVLTQRAPIDLLVRVECTDSRADVSGAFGTAFLNLEQGGQIGCRFTNRALGRESGQIQLARAFAPIVHLSRGERFSPIRMEDFLESASLRTGIRGRHRPGSDHVVDITPTLFSIGSPFTFATYLDVRVAEPFFKPGRYAERHSEIERKYPRPTVYWHIAKDKALTALQYWFLYLYNDFSNKHEADWEQITVFLRSGEAIGTAYSAHQGTGWRPWRPTHPHVYVARGSHANYYNAPHRESVRVCGRIGGRERCLPTPVSDRATLGGRVLAPGSYDLVELGGRRYLGDWGSGNYLGRVQQTSDRLPDPRTREAFTNPFTLMKS